MVLYISILYSTLAILKSCIINREIANGHDHHHIFTHWQSITFCCTKAWLYISPDHCNIFYTLIRTFSFFNQINPSIFNEYIEDYPPILSPPMLSPQTNAPVKIDP